jgi:hypothetical protein
MKVKQIFKIIQGHQITDEELYLNEGNIPVITGKNEIKGYWNKEILDEKYLPCITYPTKANSGEAYVQVNKFDANNTALLIPLPEWKGKIDLYWFSYKLPTIFLSVQTSKEGVSYLNKDIVENIDIEIPNDTIQIKELKYFKEIDLLKRKLIRIEKKIDLLLTKSLIINKIFKTILLSNLLEYVSRNDALSEEGLYKKSLHLINAKNKIKVISGSIDGFYGYYPYDDSIHFIENKSCLQVITRGKAGLLRFLEKGNYATNTNSMLLLIKEESKEMINVNNDKDEDIYLKFLEIFLYPYFKEFSSSADLAVFPLTKAINQISIPLMKLDNNLKDIVNKYEELKNYKLKINLLITKIDDLFNKEIKYC